MKKVFVKATAVAAMLLSMSSIGFAYDSYRPYH